MCQALFISFRQTGFFRRTGLFRCTQMQNRTGLLQEYQIHRMKEDSAHIDDILAVHFQHLFFIDIIPVSSADQLHQLLRGTGGIGLHISRYPPADRSQGRLGHTGVLFPQTAAGSSCRRRASSTAAGRRDCGPAPGPGGPAQVRPNWGLCQRLHRGQKCQRVWGHPNKHFCGAKTASVYTLALLDTNVHPTNLRKCKKSNYLPILDVFKDFATIVVDDSPNHNRNLRKILIFSHVRLNNYNIPFYYNMWRTMQRRSEVSCRTKY